MSLIPNVDIFSKSKCSDSSFFYHLLNLFDLSGFTTLFIITYSFLYFGTSFFWASKLHRWGSYFETHGFLSLGLGYTELSSVCFAFSNAPVNLSYGKWISIRSCCLLQVCCSGLCSCTTTSTRYKSIWNAPGNASDVNWSWGNCTINSIWNFKHACKMRTFMKLFYLIKVYCELLPGKWNKL